jgi:hypothetical protein
VEVRTAYGRNSVRITTDSNRTESSARDMDPVHTLIITGPSHSVWPVQTNGICLTLLEVVPRLMDVKMNTRPSHIRDAIFTEYGVKFSSEHCTKIKRDILNRRAERGSKGIIEMDVTNRARGLRAKSLGHARNQSVQARRMQRPDLLQNKPNVSSDLDWGYVHEVEKGKIFPPGFPVDDDGSEDSRSTAPASVYESPRPPRSLTQYLDDLNLRRHDEERRSSVESSITIPRRPSVSESNSEEPVQLDKVAQTFKKMAGKAWKSSATFTAISPTISRDNTSGEHARQAKLFAEFAGRGRPCVLSSNQAQRSLEGLFPSQYEDSSRLNYVYDRGKNEFPIEVVKDDDNVFSPRIWQCACKHQNLYKNDNCLRCGASRTGAILLID